MACPNEYAWSVYVDGETEPDESRQLVSHLDECRRCRDLVADLAEEGRLLANWLQEVDLEPQAEPVSDSAIARSSLLSLGIAVLVPATVFRVALDWLAGAQAPPFLAWLNPLAVSGQLTLSLNLIVYAINEGGFIVTSMVRNSSSAVLTILLLSALMRLIRPSLRSSALLGTLFLVVFAAPGQAIDLRRGEANVTVAAGETIDDSLVFFGESITIDGTVTGDLLAFGRQITVRGLVEGSVFSFAQRVELTGRIGGNLIGIAQSVRVDGAAGGNLYAGAQSFTVGDDGEVGGNGFVGAQDVLINGAVGRDLMVGANSLIIAGSVGRNLLFGGEDLTVQEPARIAGNLEAHMIEEENFRVDPGAAILGTTTLEMPTTEPNRFRTIAFYIGRLIRLAAALIAGLVLFWLFPPARQIRLDNGRALLTAGGIGFLVAVATPVAAFFVGITLIGLPLAMTSVAAWLLGLYLGKVVIAGFIGRAMLTSGAVETASMLWPLLAGLVVVSIAVSLPYVGGVVNVLLTLMGLGALMLTGYQSWRDRARAETQEM